MTSCFAVAEHSWQGPATSCKIFPGAEIAETWRHSGAKVTLFDATPCHGSALITSPSIVVSYAPCVTSGNPDTWPDRHHVMHQPHVRWEVSCCSIIKRLCVSAFILIMSVSSAACLLAVENVIGDCLQSETTMGIKCQTLEKLGGATYGSRHCYYGLKGLTFS